MLALSLSPFPINKQVSILYNFTLEFLLTFVQ